MSNGAKQSDEDGYSGVSYKYQRLRERLREAIKSGELHEKLPGERLLAKRYAANAKTINKALSDLTVEGLLTRQVGRGTFVSGSDVPHSVEGVQSRLFGWLGGPDADGVHMGHCYTRARDLLEAKGCRLEMVNKSIEAGAVEERDLYAGGLRGVAGFIACCHVPSLRLLAGVQRRHLPMVVVNNTHAAGRVSAVKVDYAHGAYELTQHLILLGHQRVTLAVDADLLPAAGTAELGHQTALKRYRMAWERARIAEGTRENLLTNASGALVCVGVKSAAAALGQAQQAGLRIPEQLSVAVIAEPGATLPAERNLTAYEVDRDRVIEWATELLVSATPGSRPRLVIVPGRVHLRASTAPPSSGAGSPVPAPEEAIL